MKIAYFVHDLNDMAVARRVAMMRAGGLAPIVLGFRRSAVPPLEIEGAPAIDLGRTADARLIHRALAVLRNLVGGWRISTAVRDCDIFMARNLESLVLAERASGGRRLVYECLDVHRTLLGSSHLDRAVQWIEARLLARIQLLLVSSPAFLSGHFDRRPMLRAPAMVIENKVMDAGPDRRDEDRPAGPPWRIGWFGMLRCRRSLDILSQLVERSEGRVELLIAGKPARSELGDFEALIAGKPGIEFAGAYAPADLPALYGRVHFAWAIDYFEEGLNSAWLLPNRLYEASFHGAIPIALDTVQTGKWLAQRDAGMLVHRPLEELTDRLSTFGEADYARERARLRQIAPSDLQISEPDCIGLARALEGAA